MTQYGKQMTAEILKSEILFPASDLTIHRQRLDGDEQIDIHELSWGAAIEMIGSGRIQDAETIAGLLMADRWFKGRLA